MRKFSKEIIIGLVLIIVADYIVGSSLRYFYFKQTSDFLHRTTYSMEITEAEILIFGSSRASRHYNPRIFEEETGLSTYNTGRDGNFIFYQTAILKSIISRYNPKLIILDFEGTFEFNQQDYDKLASLLPYYKSHPEIREIVLLKSKYENLKLLSRIYPFNSILTTIAFGNMDFNKNRSRNKGSYNGFIPLSGVFSNMIDSVHFPKQYEIDPNKYKVFEDFLKISKQNDIPLIVVYSPVYFLYNENYSKVICKQICDKNDVVFIDFSRDEDFINHKELFKDKFHLNGEGADLLTRKMLDFIEKRNL
jgi:hypothetical protein